MKEIERFLALLWPETSLSLLPIQAHLSLWSHPSKRSVHLPVRDRQAIVSTAEVLDKTQQNVYFGVGLRSGNLGPSERGGKADVIVLGGLWCDIDLASPVHASQTLPPSLEAAGAILDAFQAMPTVVVGSGYGLHAWWLFSEPLVFEPGQAELPRKLAKALQVRVQGIAKDMGYHVDSTHDLARVLRLPGMTNWKVPEEPKPVVLLIEDGPRHDVEALRALLVKPVGRPSGSSSGPPGVGEAPSGPPSPDAASNAGGAGFSPACVEAIRRLKRLKNDDHRDLVKLVLKGKSFAQPGARDETLQRVASIIAFVDPDTDAADLATILAASLESMAKDANDPQNPSPTLEHATEKITRAQQDARIVRDQREEQNQRLRRTLIAQARRMGRDPEGTQTRPEGGGPENGNDPFPDEEGEYTEAEIMRFAASQGCTRDEFKRRWIIQRSHGYYVFVNGRYRAPLIREELEVSLPRDLSPAPIEWTIEKADGTERQKKIPEILSDYCTVARDLIADLTIEKSHYDPTTETFFEAVCPIRRITPLYDEEIHKWLTFLGGDEIEKLLDWIATVSVLDRQSCALYLSGVSGTGKTMLGHGLARLWTEGPPSELTRILDNFNADLTRCPLVMADEHIPQNWRGNRASAEIRQLVGTTARSLSRKFLPNATLNGAVRLLLAANNDRLLALGDEDLSREDLEAVASRFLHIPVGREAADYLKSLDGWEGTKGWVVEDKIARHALWIREHRNIEAGKRFLVEGHQSQMHEALAAQGAVPSLVIEWLARYLDEPIKNIEQKKLALIGNGHFCVNTNAVTEFWDSYIKSGNVPTTQRIGRILKNNRFDEVRINNLRYHRMNAETILSWAERNQVGSIERMQARLVAQIAMPKADVK